MIVKMKFEDSENALLDEYRRETLDDGVYIVKFVPECWMLMSGSLDRVSQPSFRQPMAPM